MSAVRTSNGSFKIVATIGMVLLMAFFSACDVLATEGARDAIANGREIREFEDENLRPLEQEMNDLWVTEIEPRERELEDLRYELQVMQDELLSPLWDAQNDQWGPDGEGTLLQQKFDALNREYELMQRAIDIEQRELDADWQVLWGSNTVDPEYQALEDLRFEKQRELDRMYRFGNRPIDDLWDEINELNASQGFSNTDSQIEAELINVELRRLWDLQNELQNGANDDVNSLYEQAANAQQELDNLYRFGWDPINLIYSEIEQLEVEQNNFGFDAAGNPIGTSGTGGGSSAELAELESILAGYIANRDGELAAWEATLAELESEAESVEIETTGASPELLAQIAEYEEIIAGLEVFIAELIESREAHKAELEVLIEEKNALYDQLIDDEIAAFLVVSSELLGQVEAIEVQIAELTEADPVANADQIAVLEAQKAVLVGQEEAAEAALHVSKDQLEADREFGIADLESQIAAVQIELDGELTAPAEGEKADYEAQLVLLKIEAEQSEIATTSIDDNSEAIAEVLASIAATKDHWNPRIDEIAAKIATFNNEATVQGVDDALESRISNLRLQAAEMENNLNASISKLENLINDLYNQANDLNSGDSGEMAEIQRQIDELNRKLEGIWQQNSSNGLEVLLQTQTLEKQVRVLEEEREDEQYRLEEELWDLDDQLSRFYKGQNSEYQLKEIAFQAVSDDLQQRRFELDELRWQAGIDQQDAWDALNDKQNDAGEQIKVIEKEQLGAINDKIRAIEDELQVFYDQRRDIENAIRVAQDLVEQKKRELEDKVFDALESAAGTVDEAGDTVVTATEETGSATGIDEGDGSTDGTIGADGTAN